jgi:hypothetical protein
LPLLELPLEKEEDKGKVELISVCGGVIIGY